MFAVEFCHLSKSYGKNEKQALNDINFSIDAGSFFGILAPNHAGKTSLLRLIFNYIRPDHGNIFVFERDSLTNSAKIRRYASFVPAQVNGHSRLRVKAILTQLHAPMGTPDEEKLLELCQKFNLDPLARFDALTVCQRKCLSIVAALLNDPPLIVLDEPSLGLDLPMRMQTFSELHKLHENGSTIIFSTISAEEIAVHSTHTAILQNGTVLNVAPTVQCAALHAQRVRLESPDTAEIIQALGFEHFHSHSRVVSFLYTESIDTLIKTLASYSVTSLTIEPPNMDSILRATNLLKINNPSTASSQGASLNDILKRGNLFEDDEEDETPRHAIINFEFEDETIESTASSEGTEKGTEQVTPTPNQSDTADEKPENETENKSEPPVSPKPNEPKAAEPNAVPTEDEKKEKPIEQTIFPKMTVYSTSKSKKISAPVLESTAPEDKKTEEMTEAGGKEET